MKPNWEWESISIVGKEELVNCFEFSCSNVNKDVNKDESMNRHGSILNFSYLNNN